MSIKIKIESIESNLQPLMCPMQLFAFDFDTFKASIISSDGVVYIFFFITSLQGPKPL